MNPLNQQQADWLLLISVLSLDEIINVLNGV